MWAFLASFVLFPVISAQNFTISSSWRKPSIDRSLDELVKIAQVVDDVFCSNYNGVWSPSSALTYYSRALYPITYSALAKKDIYSGTLDNRQWVTNNIKLVIGRNTGFNSTTSVDWPILFGIAALDAYRAYADLDMLQIARDMWNVSSQWQVTEEHASAGRHPGKNFSIVSTCQGKTTAGAVFWSTSLNSGTEIWTFTPAHFATFSASLADIEGSEGRNNTLYKNAAVLTGNFILEQILDPVSSLSFNTLEIGVKGSCVLDQAFNSANTGLAIEVFAILADLTGDSKWANAMSRMIVSAATTPIWSGNDGIITEASKSSAVSTKALKGHFMGSLYEPWARTKDKNLKAYIQGYVNVQYNALLDLATSNSSGCYSSNWRGPPATVILLDGTTAAVGLTAVAVGVNNGTTAAISPGGPNSNDDKNRASSNLGVPLGVGLGVGIPLLLFSFIGGFLLFRRRQRNEPSLSELPGGEKPNIPLHTPSLQPIPFQPPSSGPSESTQPALVPERARMPVRGPEATIESDGNSLYTTAPNGKETMLAWRAEDQSAQTNAVGSGSSLGRNIADALPTVELVRVLNDRVNQGDETQGDSPPVYRERPQ